MKRNQCFLFMSFLSIFSLPFLLYTQETGTGGHSGLLLPLVLSALMVFGSLALKVGLR